MIKLSLIKNYGKQWLLQVFSKEERNNFYNTNSSSILLASAKMLMRWNNITFPSKEEHKHMVIILRYYAYTSIDSIISESSGKFYINQK